MKEWLGGHCAPWDAMPFPLPLVPKQSQLDKYRHGYGLPSCALRFQQWGRAEGTDLCVGLDVVRSGGVEVKVLVTQSCLTVCDPMTCSPLGSSVHGILQTRILEWFAMPLSRGSSWPRDWTHVSCLADWLFALWATKHNIECMQIFQAGVGEGVLWFSRETGLKGLCVYKCQLSTLNMI